MNTTLILLIAVLSIITGGSIGWFLYQFWNSYRLKKAQSTVAESADLLFQKELVRGVTLQVEQAKNSLEAAAASAQQINQGIDMPTLKSMIASCEKQLAQLKTRLQNSMKKAGITLWETETPVLTGGNTDPQKQINATIGVIKDLTGGKTNLQFGDVVTKLKALDSSINTFGDFAKKDVKVREGLLGKIVEQYKKAPSNGTDVWEATVTK